MRSDRKEVVFSNHVLTQMVDRGTNQKEIKLAIQQGECIPAKKDRIAFRKNFSFRSHWKNRYYEDKQVMPIVKQEANKIIVITVYVFFFGGER